MIPRGVPGAWERVDAAACRKPSGVIGAIHLGVKGAGLIESVPGIIGTVRVSGAGVKGSGLVESIRNLGTCENATEATDVGIAGPLDAKGVDGADLPNVKGVDGITGKRRSMPGDLWVSRTMRPLGSTCPPRRCSMWEATNLRSFLCALPV